jgi:hypothetical protein
MKCIEEMHVNTQNAININACIVHRQCAAQHAY